MKAMPDVIKIAARELRENMTKAEIQLWKYIRRKQLANKQFQKQKPIYVYTEDSWLARYIIADFYCAENKLIIELDWTIHDIPEILALDKHKQMLLVKSWYTVIRFKNEEVFNNLKKVLESITMSLK